MIIKDCIITKSDAKVLREWQVSKNNIHSGIDLSGGEVYAPFYGVVIDCLYTPTEKNVIIIQYNAFICTRLCNLKSVAVKRGDLVVTGDKLGECDGYVHVEYLSSQKPDGIPPMSVRIENLSYYKVNPTDFIEGKISFPISGIVNVTIQTFASDLPELKEVSYEFGDNR